MKPEEYNTPKTRTVRLVEIFYHLISMAASVPLAFIIRTGGLVQLDRNLIILTASFSVFAAAGYWIHDLRPKAVSQRALPHMLAAIVLSMGCAMAAALVMTLVIARLDGIPRSIPFLGVAVASALAMLPRLLQVLPGIWHSMRQVALQNPETGRAATEEAKAGPAVAMSAAGPARSGMGFKQWMDTILVTSLPVAVGMTMVGPQGLTWFCAIVAALMLAVLALETGRADLRGLFEPIWPFLAALGLLMAWAAGRSIGSASIEAALPILAAFGFSLCSVVLAAIAAYRIQPGPRWYWVFFPMTQIAAAVLLGIAIILAADTTFQVFQTGRMTQGYHYNRLALLVALLYPLSVFAIQQMALARPSRLITHVVVAAAVLTTTFLSESESAKLALIVMIGVYLVSQISMTWTRRMVVTASVGLVLLAPVALHVLFLTAKDSALWSFRPGTFAARIAVWEEILALVTSAPIIGSGVEIIRVQGVRDAATQAAKMYHHPHSFLLQTWVDLGLIGAVLMSACLVAAWRLLRHIDGEAGSMFLALMAGILSIWAVSHGMWQSWYVGLSGIVVVFAVLAYRRSLPAR